MATYDEHGWLPIETAPRDGSYIIVTNPEAQVSWVAKFQERYASGWRPENLWSSMMLNHWHSPVRYHSTVPTHWQPLPKPPVGA